MQLCLEICVKHNLLSQSLLEILDTQGNCITTEYMTGDWAERHGDGGMDGRGTVTDYTGYRRACEGRGKHVFVFQVWPHAGFLLDDRWHTAHCRYHSAPPLPPPPTFTLTSPYGYCFTPILPPAHQHPPDTSIHCLFHHVFVLQHWSSSQVC